MARSTFTAGTWAGTATAFSTVVGTWAAGDTMLACVMFTDGTATVSSWSMTGESAPSSVGTIRRGGPSSTSIAWGLLSNVTGTGSKTITANITGAGATGVVLVWRLTGRDTSSAFDAENGGGGTGSPSAGSAVTAAAGSDVFGAASTGGFSDATPTNGTQETVPNFNYDAAAYLENQTGSIDIGPWTWGGGGAYVVSVIAVKAAGGGGGGSSQTITTFKIHGKRPRGFAPGIAH